MQKQTRRSSADWEQIISEQRNSGLSVKAYSQKYGFNYNTLIYWRQQFKTKSSSFVSLYQGQTDKTSMEKIRVNYGHHIELELPADYPTADLVALLKGLSC